MMHFLTEHLRLCNKSGGNNHQEDGTDKISRMIGKRRRIISEEPYKTILGDDLAFII
jgi:hypothetical protein